MIRWDYLTDKVTNLLGKALALRSSRQEIIASNVANLDTPRYTRKDLNFRAVLADYLHGIQGISLARTDPGHIPGGDPNLGIQVQDTLEKVDLDQEMIKLTQNNLLYHANVQMLIKKLEILRAAIEGGK